MSRQGGLRLEFPHHAQSCDVSRGDRLIGSNHEGLLLLSALRNLSNFLRKYLST